jgi:hypothetical protein
LRQRQHCRAVPAFVLGTRPIARPCEDRIGGKDCARRLPLEVDAQLAVGRFTNTLSK